MAVDSAAEEAGVVAAAETATVAEGAAAQKEVMGVMVVELVTASRVEKEV